MDLLGFKSAGIIRNLKVRNVSGGGANYDVIMFDKVAESTTSAIHQIYSASSVGYNSEATANIYYDTRTEETDDDLGIKITPASDGVFDIRITIEILM